MALNQTDLEFHLGSVLLVKKSNLFYCQVAKWRAQQGQEETLFPLERPPVAETSLTPETAGHQVHSAK